MRTFARVMLLPLGALIATLAQAAQAQTVKYNLSWTGTSNYSMIGNFTYDLSAGPEVRDYEVKSLFIDVRSNGTSIGTWTLPTGTQSASFNFNFDAANGTFFQGGATTSDTGQYWNAMGAITPNSVGFVSGSGVQVVTDTSSNPQGNNSPFGLRASLAPEPSAWGLMILGFGLVGATLRRRARPALGGRLRLSTI